MSDARLPWSVRFRREREASWRELEELVARAEREGLKRLGAERTARLPVLYRAAVSALGVARASVLDKGLLLYLEALVGRAYLQVYSPQRPAAAVAAGFVARGFPAAVRSVAWHVLAAWGLLGLGFALAFAMVDADMEHYYLFLDPAMAQGRDPTASSESLRGTLFAGDSEHALLTFTAFLFTHNSSVGILTFGLGFVFGLPVALLLLYNGMILGAMSALFHARGLAVEWWSWILPHGVTELTAIVLCGAAGLAIGQALVFPGRRSRLTRLATDGRNMGGVVAGAVLMLLVAGFIEGVFRQVVQDLTARYVLASLSATAWIAYFAGAGRGAK